MPNCLLTARQETKLVMLRNENSQLLLGNAAHLHQCFALHGEAPAWHFISILGSKKVHAVARSSVYSVNSHVTRPGIVP